MFTDIVGYTSLTESDEVLAMKLLNEHRKIVRPLISSHNGKEVKTMGDAFLVEFVSAIEAIRCALEIQESLSRFNTNRKFEDKILLRIGIHLGDVIHSEKDVYGDAVNIASRIEGIAEPGGICVSRQVYDSVRNKARSMKFESLGFKQLKNLTNEVEVLRVVTPWEEGGELQSSYYTPLEEEAPQPKNRVAVLPFVNIGPDPTDEYFADGLTEELISRLSQAKDLRVIARTTSMNYKDERRKKLREIGRELGAGTIIEGSVRKAGTKIRVSVQIVNAVNEEHIWSSRYDRNLDDIFEIQTDIAEKVADSFSSTLAPMMHTQIRGSEETQNITAYTYFLEGLHLFHGEGETSVQNALDLFTKSIEVDPGFARAYVGRADCYLALTEFAHITFVDAATRAEEDAKKALELDPGLADAHATFSHVMYTLDEITTAEREARRAIELNPSLSDAYHALGHIMSVKGEREESVRLFETAHKLDPLNEDNIVMLSQIYLDSRREEEALRLLATVEHVFPQATFYGIAWYHLLKHDYAKAAEFLERFKLVAGSDSIVAIGLEGDIMADRGDRAKALECIARIEQSANKETIANGIVGTIYYILGDMDSFFDYMNRALSIHALPLGALVNSQLYAKARQDPRFKKLLEYYKFQINYA